jgi:hypothetical protein
MVFRGLVGVTRRKLCVAMRYERLMRRMGVIAFFVMLGSVAVMHRGRFMMLRRYEMVLVARECFSHDLSDAIVGGRSRQPARPSGAWTPIPLVYARQARLSLSVCGFSAIMVEALARHAWTWLQVLRDVGRLEQVKATPLA